MLDNLLDKKLLLHLNKLNLKESDGQLFWDGTYDASCLFSGLKVIPIKPEKVLNPSNSMSNYAFDKQVMLDIGVTIQQYTSTTSISSTVKDIGDVLRKCKVCNNKN